MKLPCALIACLLVTPALALETPPPGRADPRCRQADYDPQNIVAVTTYAGRVLSVTFNPSERIEVFTTGDMSDDAPITAPDPKDMGNHPLHSTIMFWGKHPGTSDALVLTMLPDDVTEHVYHLMVTVKAAPKPGESDTDATYCLAYTYAEAEKAATKKEAAAQAAIKRQNTEQQIAEARLASNPFNGEQNWRYVRVGDESVLPDKDGASDNYAASAFRFSGTRPHPTVYIADSPAWCDLKHPPPESYLRAPERVAPVDVQDDLIIVHETATHFRFRLGEDHVADLFNCGYNPFRGNPGTGTGSPDVVRQIIQAKGP